MSRSPWIAAALVLVAAAAAVGQGGPTTSGDSARPARGTPLKLDVDSLLLPAPAELTDGQLADLLAALGDDRRGDWAARQLSDAPARAATLFDELVKRVESPRSPSAALAAKVLVEVAGRVPSAEQTLTRLLAGRQPADVRANLVAGLGRVGKPAAATLARLGQIASDPNEYDPVRVAAVVALGRHGPAASGQALNVTVAMLIAGRMPNQGFARAYGPTDGRIDLVPAAAIRTLGRMGPKADIAVPLLEILPDSFSRTNWPAVAALCRMGQSETYLPALLKAASAEPPARPASTDPWERMRQREGDPAKLHALEAIGELDSDTPSVVEALTAALKHADSAVRQAAANAIARLRPVRSDVLVAAVKAVVEQSDREPRPMQAFDFTEPPPAVVLDTLIGALKNGKPGERRMAADCLARLGRAAAPAVDELARALLSDDDRLLRDAGYALGNVGRPAVRAAPLLAHLLVSGSGEQARAAKRCFESLGWWAAPALPVFLDAINKGQSVSDCLEAIGSMGPAAADAAPAVIELSKSSNPRVVAAAVETLGRIGPVDPKVVAAVKGALYDDSPQVRELAAAAVAEFGPAAAPAAGDLVKRLGKERRYGLREREADPVERALAGIGQPAVEPVLAALKSDKPGARAAACRVLGQIRPPDKNVVAALAGMLDGQDNEVRAEALLALGRQGPLAGGLLDKLLAAAADKDARVRGYAAAALVGVAPADPRVMPLLLKTAAEYYANGILAEAFLDLAPTDRSALLAAIVLSDLRDSADRFGGRLRSLLADFEPLTADDLPVLLAAMKCPSESVKAYAAYRIMELGPAARSAAPLLAEQLASLQAGGFGGAGNALNGLIDALKALGADGSNAAAAALPKTADGNHRRWLLGAMLTGQAPTDPKAVAPLVEALKDGDFDNCRMATIVLGRMGPLAKPAAKAILESGSRANDSEAVIALARIGALDESTHALVASALVDSYPGNMRQREAEEIGRAGKPVVPALIAALSHKKEGVRTAAIYALGFAGADARPAIPALVKLIGVTNDVGDWQGKMAIRTLGRIGPDAAAAVPALVRLFRQDNADAQLLAPVLGQIGTDEAVEALLAQLDKNEYDRGQVLAALRLTGGKARKAVDKLWALLDAGGKVDLDVAAMLIEMNVPPDKLLPALTKALATPETARQAAGLLAALGPSAKPAVPALARAVEAGSREAIEALAELGPVAREALPALRKLAEADPNGINGTWAKGAIARIEGGERAGDRPVGRPVGDFPPPPTRAAASIRPLVAQLIRCLGFGQPGARGCYAAWVLSGLGPEAAPAVEQLVNAVGMDRSPRTLVVFARTFEAIGPAARPALPMLSEWRDSDATQPEVREAVSRALQAIRRPAGSSPPATAPERD